MLSRTPSTSARSLIRAAECAGSIETDSVNEATKAKRNILSRRYKGGPFCKRPQFGRADQSERRASWRRFQKTLLFNTIGSGAGIGAVRRQRAGGTRCREKISLLTKPLCAQAHSRRGWISWCKDDQGFGVRRIGRPAAGRRRFEHAGRIRRIVQGRRRLGGDDSVARRRDCIGVLARRADRAAKRRGQPRQEPGDGGTRIVIARADPGRPH